MPSLPSPSQSPVIGMPRAPVGSARVTFRQTEGLLPSAGAGPSASSHSGPRTTPKSVMPSPFQSPVTGRSPARPKAKAGAVPVVRTIEGRSRHWPATKVAGALRTVAVPVAEKPHASGGQPGQGVGHEAADGEARPQPPRAGVRRGAEQARQVWPSPRRYRARRTTQG